MQMGWSGLRTICQGSTVVDVDFVAFLGFAIAFYLAGDFDVERFGFCSDEWDGQCHKHGDE